MQIFVIYPNKNFGLIEFAAVPRIGDIYYNLDSDKKFKVVSVIHRANGENLKTPLPPQTQIILGDVE